MNHVLFLDVDGVLTKFAESAAEACEHPGASIDCWDFFKRWGLTEEQFWSILDSKGERFWSDMPFLSWADEVLAMCREYADKVVLLTSPPRVAHAWSGRVLSLQRRFGGPTFRDYILCPAGHKELLAGPGRVLVDDRDENCAMFRAAGGEAIVFPRLWNSGRVVDCWQSYLERNLKLWRRT